MGNSNLSPLPNYPYNKLVNSNRPFGENFCGPFVHPIVNDFEKKLQKNIKIKLSLKIT